MHKCRTYGTDKLSLHLYAGTSVMDSFSWASFRTSLWKLQQQAPMLAKLESVIKHKHAGHA